MAIPENVLKFENENTKVYKVIQGYFNELNRRNRDYEEIKSNKTQEAYETDIRLYFELVKGKSKGSELEYLTMDELKIEQDDLEKFRDILFELKNNKGENRYANKTINRKLTALKGLIKFIKRKRVFEDYDISFVELIKGEKERKNHYGALTQDEVIQMSKLAEKEKHKDSIKKLIILTAFKTGLRRAELLNLKWNDFIIKDNEVIIDGVGKGNKEFEIKITKEFYNELLTIKKDSENVFDLTEKNITDMMSRFKKILDIQKERNIVFHSIRKAFGTMVYEATGDINAARIALRHENINTTQIYLGVTDYKIHETLFQADTIDENLYKQVELETLISAISELPKNTQLLINVKIKEILNNN